MRMSGRLGRFLVSCWWLLFLPLPLDFSPTVDSCPGRDAGLGSAGGARRATSTSAPHRRQRMRRPTADSSEWNCSPQRQRTVRVAMCTIYNSLPGVGRSSAGRGKRPTQCGARAIVRHRPARAGDAVDRMPCVPPRRAGACVERDRNVVRLNELSVGRQAPRTARARASLGLPSSCKARSLLGMGAAPPSAVTPDSARASAGCRSAQAPALSHPGSPTPAFVAVDVGVRPIFSRNRSGDRT